MTGEAQVVERVISEFCQQYYDSLPEGHMYENKDSLHTFTYALMMLHTDMHKQAITERMTVE
jgi:Sec7-like guanine-nucleotide exchange factor